MNEPIVSIGILSEKEIHFDLYGEFKDLVNGHRFSGIFKAKLKDGDVALFQDSSEIVKAKDFHFVPNDIETESFLIRNVVIGKDFHWQKKENQRFRGSLKLIIEDDKLTAINILPLEEYLTSVISSEMSSNSSLELLKAHAIVSRGWLLAQFEREIKTAVTEKISEDEIIKWYDRTDHKNFDFCADDHCQRYQGITKIMNENAANAVAATRGLILTYKNKICDTRYSKCCGGMTESFENVWEPEVHEYLSSMVDYKFEPDGAEVDLHDEKSAERWIEGNPHSFCNTSNKKVLSQVLVDFDYKTKDFFRWEVKYTQQELAGLIKTKSGIDFGQIIDLIPVERGYSARIIRLKIVGEKRTVTIGKELEIRKTLSQTHLYSSAFIIKKENTIEGIPQQFTFEGAGWGHGVGMCQIGAAVMGDMGYSFDEILTHYFRNALIKKLY